MTATIPIPAHLADFPVDDRGLPVTWASAWESEIRDHHDVRPEPLLPGSPDAVFTGGHQYQGRPDNGAPNVQRTRQCVLNDRCQVCGDYTDDRLICALTAGWDRLRVDGRMVPLLIDAWTCGRCLPYALLACPHLSTRRAPVRVLHVREWLPIPTPERPRYLTVDRLPYGPIGFVKIAVLDFGEASA